MVSARLATLSFVCACVAACEASTARDVASEDVADAQDDTATGEVDTEVDDAAAFYLAAEPQRDGDPAKGFQTLAAGAYVGCGVPAELVPVAQGAGVFGDEPGLPGRDGDLPYYLSQFTVASGVEVVGPNCFTCHAGTVQGELFLGAPGIDLDFGGFASQIASFKEQLPLAESLLSPESYAELVRFATRLELIAPWVQTAVAGTNPADNLAGILFSHRDRETLAWSETPLIEPPDQVVLPVDVPPLWRMKKKHAMFYAAAGRGDHARIMMTTSTLCVDGRSEAEAIDKTFGDVRAWITSLEAPRWNPAFGGEIDPVLAAEGKDLFVATCQRCHGTYGDDDAVERYPNRWVPAEEVGTDPAVALGAAHAATRFVTWFNESFYGETAHLDPKPGYVPPPLDGIWATGPFLHNGSVPTLATLLDASKRPRYWRRTSAWNAAELGLGYTTVEVGHDQITTNAKRFVYDTTLLGHGNGGHTYGDRLTPEQRTALLEYLKTL
jgi:mono/diheme cytochrome c family protein